MRGPLAGNSNLLLRIQNDEKFNMGHNKMKGYLPSY